MVDTKVAEGFVEISIDLATLNQGLARARRSFTQSLGNIQKSADRVGKRLSIALTAPLLAAGIASGKVAGTFEINMAKITGLVGIAADEVKLLGDAVLELGPQVGKGPIELSKALFTITSAGARGQAALELLTASAKAASAGLGETEDVAKATASAMQAFSKDNLTAAQTISTLVNIVKKGNLEGRDLAATFSRVTPFAASLGIALNEAGAAMAVISLTAPDASQAATQLEALFRSLGRSTPILEEALEKLGLSFEGVQAQLQQDGLLATLRTLQSEANRTGTRLNELFVDSSAAAGAMAILNIDAGIVDDTFKALAQTTEQDLDKAFRAVADTGAFKFTQALVSIQTAATQIGQVILPILAPVLTKIAAAVITAGNAFADLNPELQSTLLGGVALAAALGPALIVFGLIVGAISTTLTAVAVLATGFITFARIAVASIAAVQLAIFSIPGLIVATGLAIFVLQDTIKTVFSTIGSIISKSFELAFAKAENIFDGFINGIISGINSVAEFARLPKIEFRLEGPSDQDVLDIAKDLLKLEGELGGKIADQFEADIKRATESVKTGFTEIKKIISDTFELPGFEAIVAKFPELTGKFKDAISELNNSISSNFDETLAKLRAGLDNLETKTKSTAGSIKDIVEDVSSTVASSITNVVTGATSALQALRSVANQIIGSIISSIIGSPSEGGFLGSLFGSAKGNVFQGGAPVPFANGGIIGGRTTFPMGNGGTGLAGEAGIEGILPLSRVAGGKLGVSAEGLGGNNVVINQTNNFTPDVRATTREEIANAAPILINAAVQATLAAMSGRRT